MITRCSKRHFRPWQMNWSLTLTLSWHLQNIGSNLPWVCSISSSSTCWDPLPQLRCKVERSTLTEACPRVSRALTLMRASTQYLSPEKRSRGDGRHLERSSTQGTSLSRLGSSMPPLSSHRKPIVTLVALIPLKHLPCP